MINKNDLKVNNFIMLTFAGIINAFGITMFLSPVYLYDSGIKSREQYLQYMQYILLPYIHYLHGF